MLTERILNLMDGILNGQRNSEIGQNDQKLMTICGHVVFWLTQVLRFKYPRNIQKSA